jgi:hypothetical protein
MRHGSTIVPAVLVLAVALLGAGGNREASTADWVAITNAHFGQRIAPIYLLPRPDVQRDLRLSPEQVAGARAEVGRLIERGLNLKREARPEAIQAEKRQIDEQMAAWLLDKLSPEQLDRLTQIQFQWEGASALRREAIAEYLRLHEGQRLKVQNLLTERDQRWIKGALKPGEFERFSREALGVLTPPQKEQWDNLLGPPCRFSIGRAATTTGHAAAAPGVQGSRPSPAR